MAVTPSAEEKMLTEISCLTSNVNTARALRGLCKLESNPYLDRGTDVEKLGEKVYFSESAESVAAAAAQEYKLGVGLNKVSVPKNSPVETKSITTKPGISKGVYATEDFKVGDCLGIYTGLYIDSVTYSLLLKSRKAHRFIAEVVPGLYVDGRFGDAFAEMNHAGKPNASLCIMKAKGKPDNLQIGVFCKVGIKAGDEVTLHYDGPMASGAPKWIFKPSYEAEHNRIFDGKGNLGDVIAFDEDIASNLKVLDVQRIRGHLESCKAAEASEVMQLQHLIHSGRLQEGSLKWTKPPAVAHQQKESSAKNLFNLNFEFKNRLATLVQQHEMAFGGMLPEINLYADDNRIRLFANPDVRDSSSVKIAHLEKSVLKLLLRHVYLQVGGLEPKHSYGVVNNMPQEFFSSFQLEGKSVSTLMICNSNFHVCVPTRYGKKVLQERGWRLANLGPTNRVPFQVTTEGTSPSNGTVFAVGANRYVLIPAGTLHSYILPCK
jgi:hypothetical protein